MLAFVVPALMSTMLALFVGGLVKSSDSLHFKNDNNGVRIEMSDKPDLPEDKARQTTSAAANSNDGEAESTPDEAKKRESSLREGIFTLIFNLLWSPVLVLLSAITSIITALLYLKTRQAGGESISELLAQLAETERTPKRWQQRMISKLEQSGRQTSRSFFKSGSPSSK